MDFVIEDADDGRPFSYSAPSSSALRSNTADPYDFQIEDEGATSNSFLPSSALANLGAATKKTGFGKQYGGRPENKRDTGMIAPGRGVRSQLSAKADDILSKYKARARTVAGRSSLAASATSLDESTSVDVSDSFGSPSPRKVSLHKKRGGSQREESASASIPSTPPQQSNGLQAPEMASSKLGGITSSTLFGKVMNFSDLAGISSVREHAVVEDDSEGSIISEHVGDHHAHADFALGRHTEAKHAYMPGQHITARYRNGNDWFAGKVLATNSDGSYAVEYDDGDEEDGVLASNIRVRAPGITEEQSRFANSDSPSLGRSTSVYSMRYDEDEDGAGPGMKQSAVSRHIASSIAESVDAVVDDAHILPSARNASVIQAVEESTANDEYSNDFELTTHGSISQLPTNALPPSVINTTSQHQPQIRAMGHPQHQFERVITARKPVASSSCRDACVQTDENDAAPGFPAASSYSQIPPSPYYPGYWPPMPGYVHSSFLPSGGPFPPPVSPFGTLSMHARGANPYTGYGLAQTLSSMPSAYGPSSLAGGVYLQAFAESLNRIETQQLPMPGVSSLPSSRRSSDSGAPFRETSNAWGGFGAPTAATSPATASFPPKAPWQSASGGFQLPIPPALSQHPSVMKALSKYQSAIAASDVAFEKQLQQIRENLSRSRAMYTTTPGLIQPLGAPPNPGQRVGGDATVASSYYTPTLAETKAYLQSARDTKPVLSMQAARARVQEEARTNGGRIEVFPA
jgi:hypothetical protein